MRKPIVYESPMTQCVWTGSSTNDVLCASVSIEGYGTVEIDFDEEEDEL